MLLWQEGIEEQEAGAGDDGTVGYVEVGPMVGEDVEFDEVDDRSVDDAVVDIAERARKDEGQSDGRNVDAIAEPHQGDENDQGGEDREGNQAPADRIGRSRVGKEGESRAFVCPMSDAEKMRNDGDGFAQGDARGDQRL